MRTNSESPSARMRWTGWAGLSGTGAILIAIVMALTPAAAAANAAVVIHGTPILGDSWSQSGCAKAKVAKPGISLATGAGHMLMSTMAKSCSKALGGVTVPSSAYSDSQLGAMETVKLKAAATTVNVTWNIRALITTAVSGSIKNCAKIAPYDNFSGSFTEINSTGGSSTVFYNDSSQYCELDAFSELYTETEVFDVTTGVYSYSFNFILDNSSYDEYETYFYSDNYTNPLWYSFNSSNGCTACIFSFGLNGTSYSYSASSSSFTSGSWSTGDTLQITSYLYAYADSYVEYAKGKASAGINAATAGNHADLAGITVS